MAEPLLNLRLTAPLTSYQGNEVPPFRAIVIAPYEKGGRILLPAGSVVYGTIRRAHRVGLGFRRERASIDLDFNEYELPGGERLPMQARLRDVENARESVDGRGRIRGILAANGPQSLMHGVWHRPRLGLFPRSFIGLTGAGGRIFTAYSMGPIGAAGLFAARCAIFRLPEPEIRFPAGTELKVDVTKMPESAPSFEPAPEAALPEELRRWLTDQTISVHRPSGAASADIINVAFVGPRKGLEEAFRSAGWFEAEPLTPRSFSRAYSAYAAQRGYATAPVSRLLYQGAEPDAIFQKSLNTISKRHHIRIWRSEAQGREVWLGAATHDVGVEFNSAAASFTHKIDRRIDLERSKVVNDLAFTGCADNAGYVDRANAVLSGTDSKGVESDGRLAVLVLNGKCGGAAVEPPSDLPRPPHSRPARIARRMMLEGRQYALRGNAYYWAYRAMTLKRADKRQPAPADE